MHKVAQPEKAVKGIWNVSAYASEGFSSKPAGQSRQACLMTEESGDGSLDSEFGGWRDMVPRLLHGMLPPGSGPQHCQAAAYQAGLV